MRALVHFKAQVYYIRYRMADSPQPHKIPLIFYRSQPGHEPVREWLKALPEAE